MVARWAVATRCAVEAFFPLPGLVAVARAAALDLAAVDTFLAGPLLAKDLARTGGFEELRWLPAAPFLLCGALLLLVVFFFGEAPPLAGAPFIAAVFRAAVLVGAGGDAAFLPGVRASRPTPAFLLEPPLPETAFCDALAFLAVLDFAELALLAVLGAVRELVPRGTLRAAVVLRPNVVVFFLEAICFRHHRARRPGCCGAASPHRGRAGAQAL